MFDERQRLKLPPAGPRYSHYAFRYPAKFHPPVVAALLDRFVGPEDVLLDNFCGSGTSLIEAAISNRRSIGVDVDPVAVMVSLAKTRRYSAPSLQRDAQVVSDALNAVDRGREAYDSLTFSDISEEDFATEVARHDLWVPAIPRLDHWFRRYVSIDLARIIQTIDESPVDEENRLLILLAFAGSIRNVSNADPVPVSGLEVTSHMKRKDAEGRRIDPVAQFRAVLRKTVDAVISFSEAAEVANVPTVESGDATALRADFPTVDAVITSPPYHNAVDYYRRHQLEMFWLRHVEDHQERLDLLPKYIGRHRIPAKHALNQVEWEPGALASTWYEKMSVEDHSRATDFRHYMMSMQRVFKELRRVTRPGGPVVMVVGESVWRGSTIPTGELLAEVAAPSFSMDERLWYPIKNRYMSYSRHNGADIGHEHVLVFR